MADEEIINNSEEQKDTEETRNLDVLTENITEYLTNSVNMTSSFYNIFLKPEAEYVTFDMYDKNNELISVTVPNRAMERVVSGKGKITKITVTKPNGDQSEFPGPEVPLSISTFGAQAALVPGSNIKNFHLSDDASGVVTSIIPAAGETNPPTIDVQSPLVSKSNIRALNMQDYDGITETTLLGSGTIAVQKPLISGTNIKGLKIVNKSGEDPETTTLLASGTIAVQSPLLSETNIKGVNIVDKSGDTVTTTSLAASGTVDVQKPLESEVNIKGVKILDKKTKTLDIQSIDRDNKTFTISGDQTSLITEGSTIKATATVQARIFTVASVSFASNITSIVVEEVIPELAFTKLVVGDVTATSLTAEGTIDVQAPLESGVNIKPLRLRNNVSDEGTINSLLGSESVSVQEVLASETNIKGLKIVDKNSSNVITTSLLTDGTVKVQAPLESEINIKGLKVVDKKVKTFDIQSIDTTNKRFTVSGDQTSFFTAGTTLKAASSPIESNFVVSTFEYVSEEGTVITVTGNITSTLYDKLRIGNITFDIVNISTTNKKFTVSGDQTSFFEAGASIQAIGTPRINSFTVTSSSFASNVTSINVSEVISSGIPYSELRLGDVTTSSLTASGTLELQAPLESGVNLKKLVIKNVGESSTPTVTSFTVTSSAYNSSESETTITVSENISSSVKYVKLRANNTDFNIKRIESLAKKFIVSGNQTSSFTVSSTITASSADKTFSLLDEGSLEVQEVIDGLDEIKETTNIVVPDILSKIDDRASATNKLQAKDYIDYSIQTNSAVYQGVFETESDIPSAFPSAANQRSYNSMPQNSDFISVLEYPNPEDYTVTATDVGSKTITISGNKVLTFKPTTRIKASNATTSQSYTVESSELSNGNTVIKVTETIPSGTSYTKVNLLQTWRLRYVDPAFIRGSDETTTVTSTDVANRIFTVNGNETLKFETNTQIIAVRSGGEESYVVKESAYDIVTNKTNIEVKTAILSGVNYLTLKTPGPIINNPDYGVFSKEKWEADYPMNTSTFTDKQLDAINSGATEEKIETIGKVKQNVVSASADYPILLSSAGQSVPDTLETNFSKNITINPSTSTITAENFAGNANTANTLKASRKINGTSFNGSADITTEFWGKARNITIKDSDESHSGEATSVNGSTNYTLTLPSTIKANHIGTAELTSNTFGAALKIDRTGNTSGLSSIAFSNAGTTKGYIGVSSGDIPVPQFTNAAGSASTTLVRGSSVGSSRKGVYIDSNGEAKLMDFELNKTVPATALFTDENVKQIPQTSGDLPVILASQGQTNTVTKSVNYAANITFNPAGLLKIGTLASNTTSEGGQLDLGAPAGSPAKGGVSLDNYDSTFRIFGIPSADNTTKVGTGTALIIDPWAKTITGGYTITGTLSGNATTATTLQTARTINGTSFNGSANITTANWGTARNITIKDSDESHSGAPTSVNGSTNYTLKLPATITAAINGNCSGSSGSCTGNATTATTLQTARKINGTDFNGSADITTYSWGKERNLYISDSDETNTGVAVPVDGSSKAYLKLPATIKATLTGNATTATTLQTARTINGTSFNGSANITTANWGTARSINISDADGTHTGVAVSVNGSENYILKLPGVIKGSLAGNADTATKATQDGNGNVITSTYVPISGNLTIAGTKTFSSPVLCSGTIAAGDSSTKLATTAWTSTNFISKSANQSISGIKTYTGEVAVTGTFDGTHGIVTVATQANGNNTTAAASTAFVKNNASHYAMCAYKGRVAKSVKTVYYADVNGWIWLSDNVDDDNMHNYVVGIGTDKSSLVNYYIRSESPSTGRDNETVVFPMPKGYYYKVYSSSDATLNIPVKHYYFIPCIGDR